jgi:hypothetical protein
VTSTAPAGATYVPRCGHRPERGPHPGGEPP